MSVANEWAGGVSHQSSHNLVNKFQFFAEHGAKLNLSRPAPGRYCKQRSKSGPSESKKRRPEPTRASSDTVLLGVERTCRRGAFWPPRFPGVRADAGVHPANVCYELYPRETFQSVK